MRLLHCPVMSEHQVIVNLSGTALRQALDRADAEGVDLSELFELLLSDGEESEHRPEPSTRAPASGATASAPDALPTPTETRGQLSFLTNRLSPIKVAVTTLSALSEEGTWPTIGEFQERAADLARTVGLRLRKEDDQAGRRGAARRWTGYPVGKDADAARGRYIASFTAVTRGDETRGPLMVLGLAEPVEGGRIALTEAGSELVYAVTPLNEGIEATLSGQEIEIFRYRLRAARDEAAAITSFLGAVRHVAGDQTDLDALLATRHAEWSANRAQAERAAMLGRLGELGMIRVTGRGSDARIELLNTNGFERGEADEREAA